MKIIHKKNYRYEEKIMELRNINTFLKVAATQNFSKAAEQLGYSQSAVTVQIRPSAGERIRDAVV